MSTVIVPTNGERTDPATIQAIKDDLDSAEGRLDDLEDQVPNRKGTTSRTSNSGTFTAETVLDSVTFNQVSGVTYRLVHSCRIQSSVADGYTRTRIRQDNISGTQHVDGQMPTTIAANQSIIVMVEAEYTAASSGSKTFVATAQRQAGTGNLTATASATSPTLFYVERVS